MRISDAFDGSIKTELANVIMLIKKATTLENKLGEIRLNKSKLCDIDGNRCI